MDKDLKKLILETVEETFANAPEKLVERGIREIQYDICPHCKKEIYERHEYTEDGGVTWRHSDCKGLIARPQTPLERVDDWLKPFVKEAQEERQAARQELGLAPLPTEEPGGTMSAVNTSGLAKEASSTSEEATESKPIEGRGYERFFNGECLVANNRQEPVKVTVSKFTSRVGEIHQSAYLINIG